MRHIRDYHKYKAPSFLGRGKRAKNRARGRTKHIRKYTLQFGKEYPNKHRLFFVEAKDKIEVRSNAVSMGSIVAITHIDSKEKLEEDAFGWRVELKSIKILPSMEEGDGILFALLEKDEIYSTHETLEKAKDKAYSLWNRGTNRVGIYRNNVKVGSIACFREKPYKNDSRFVYGAAIHSVFSTTMYNIREAKEFANNAFPIPRYKKR